MVARQPFNPFYILLVLLGILFAVTACAYGVMTVKLSTAEGASASNGLWLVSLMNEHGLWLLMGELGLLAVFTFAAIGTDDFWIRRQKSAVQEPRHDDPA
jgi:hypothetical protein